MRKVAKGLLQHNNHIDLTFNGFQKNEKLNRNDDFQPLYRSKKFFTDFFIIYYLIDNSCADGRRFAVTVSKKVSKRAITRNRVRRVVKEVYRLNRQLLPAGIQMIIRAMPPASCLSNSEIKNEIKTAFSSIYSKKCGY